MHMSNNRVFGMNLKHMRKKRKMTQDDLSKKVGLSRRTISLYETGTIENISFKTVDILCKELGAEYTELFQNCG